MVLAGAGTGKTRVLVHRIAKLVERGCPPHRIWAVTFTNKAAAEMKQRLQEILGGAADRMWIGTFHGTCAKFLRRYGELVGVPSNFVIIDDDDQKRIIKRLLKEHHMEDFATPNAVRSSIDRVKSKGIDPLNHPWDEALGEVMEQIYPLYHAQLKRENAVDFGDLLLRTLQVVRLPAGEALKNSFTHILVDEFQDTNGVQYELVQKFSDQSGNLTVVGDDDQSIYSWRGAEPRHLLNFAHDFPGAETIKLEQNYRSKGHILTVANSVISENRERHEKALWTDQPDGERIAWQFCRDERDEAQFIAQSIEQHSQRGGALSGVAVLYRTHAQSRAIEEQLLRFNQPYRVVGGTSFFRRKEVLDILAYIKLLLNPASDSSFVRIINVPRRGIGKTTVGRLQKAAESQDQPVYETAQQAALGGVSAIGGAAKKKLTAFVGLLEGCSELLEAGASISELVIQVIERSGYRQKLETEGTQEATDRLNNLAELVNVASDFDAFNSGELADFVEYLTLSSSLDERAKGDCVTLMTIHAAKGLEFPIVFLSGLEDGLFPSTGNQFVLGEDNDKAMEEERRLAYVAITRAEETLVMTGASTRRVWGQTRSHFPSRFLDEMPGDCIVSLGAPLPPVVRKTNASHDEFAQDDSGFEFDQSQGDWDENPFVDEEELEARDWSVGRRVNHQKFGQGIIRGASPSGSHHKLVVEFRDAGLKCVMSNFVQQTS